MNKVLNSVAALREIGVDAKYTSDPASSVNSDLIHLIHVSYPHSLATLNIASKAGLPLVVSTVYSGEKLPRSTQQEILDYSSQVIFTSVGEKAYVARRLRIDNAKSQIIPNGVSHIFDNSPLSGEFVLCVGRLYPQKNQLQLAIACHALGLPLICIGSVVDKPYATAVHHAGAQILSPMPQLDLVDYYRRAVVCACVSTHEVHSNVVFEGGMSGSNILLTSHTLSFNEGMPNIWLCDPNPTNIEIQLNKAWKMPRNNDLRNVLRKYTWENVAFHLLSLYSKITSIDNKKNASGESKSTESRNHGV